MAAHTPELQRDKRKRPTQQESLESECLPRSRSTATSRVISIRLGENPCGHGSDLLVRAQSVRYRRLFGLHEHERDECERQLAHEQRDCATSLCGYVRVGQQYWLFERLGWCSSGSRGEVSAKNGRFDQKCLIERQRSFNSHLADI